MKIEVKIKVHHVPIQTEYIPLDNLLKLTGAVMTGGQAKHDIQSGQVKVNGDVCLQRGKKLRPGDRVSYQGKNYEVCADEGTET